MTLKYKHDKVDYYYVTLFMRKLHYFSATLLFSFSLIPTAFAATDWASLAPNNLYSSFWNVAEQSILTSQFTFNQSTGFYKKIDDTNPLSYSGVTVTGATKSSSATLGEYDTQFESLFEIGSGKKGTVYKTSVREIGENLYLSFPEAKNKALRSKWILVPQDDFEQLGLELGLETLFASIRIDNEDVSKEVYDKSIVLAKKYNLYTHFTEEIEDGYDLPNSTRHNLVLRREAIVPFYNDLDKQLSAEAKMFTPLSIDGFMQRLKEPDFVDYIAEHNYVSLWIDNTSKLPTQYLTVGSLPPPKNSKTGYIYFYSQAKWDLVNKPVTITKPSETISLTEGKKLLGIDPYAAAKEDIKALSKKASKAKNKIEKANMYLEIADIYSDFDKKTASTYYKKAASSFEKGSVDYYYSLAEAEWELKDGKKVKEYYELGLEVYPKDDILLNKYGWFLLGLSPTSVKYQDLTKALEVNKMLVKNVVDDSNLQNLYLNYLLLNKLSEADALKVKFDDFENGSTYNLIARSYHRMNNIAMTKKYQQLAKKEGYSQTAADKEFFSTKF